MKKTLVLSAFAIASVIAPLLAQDAPSAAGNSTPAPVPLPGEYLQSALLVIDPASPRLQVDLTPGAKVTASVHSLIDRNRDGNVSASETESYGAMLARDLIVRFDGRKVDLKFLGASELETAGIGAGQATLRLEYAIVLDVPAAGPHKMEVRNLHLPAISKYLLQATAPDNGTIRIDGNVADVGAGEGSVAFTYAPPAQAETSSWIGTTLAILLVLAALAGGAFWWLRGNRKRSVADFLPVIARFWKNLWKRLQGERPVSARNFQLER